MKRIATLLLAVILMLSCAACAASAPQPPAETAPATTEAPATETTAATTAPTTAPEVVNTAVQETLAMDDLPYTTTSKDGLLSITLPNQRWTELHSDEHTILFSDGDCAISVDLLWNTDTMPSVPLSDENHKLIFSSIVSANDCILFITGYVHEETDFADIHTAINSIRVDKNKVPKAEIPDVTPNYTIQDTSYTAWVTANALNVRSASGTDAIIIDSLPKNTKITVTGNVLENGKYIGWSRIKMSSGKVGFVSAQFLTTTEPKEEPARTGSSKQLWSKQGTVYWVYEYTDYTWKTDNGISYWPDGFSTWINSAGKILYDYDPTEVPDDPTPTRTGSSKQLWSKQGTVYWVYEYTDYTWKTDNGTSYWPDGFSTWMGSNGNVLYDYDPTEEPAEEPTEPPVPPANWKEEFEASLMGHDAMVVCWYSYLGDGIYEAYCEDPSNPDINGTVHVDAYTGSWNWA